MPAAFDAELDYTPPADEVPEDVAKLAADGDTLEAIKRYRELTNADADKAREVVLGL